MCIVEPSTLYQGFVAIKHINSPVLDQDFDWLRHANYQHEVILPRAPLFEESPCYTKDIVAKLPSTAVL